MYTNKLHTRTYTPSAKSLEQIPLSSLAHDYDSLVTEKYGEFNKFKADAIKREEKVFLERWNASHEESYEGDLDFIVDQVQAKLGSGPTLGSDPDYIELIEDFASKYRLSAGADWFWGQAVARFAMLPLAKNENGLYSAKALVINHIRDDSVLKALLILAKYPKRSSLVDKQTEAKVRNYCSLVPLVMSAFKKINNIGYAAWDPSEINGIVEPNLCAAMSLPSLPEVSRDEVIETRELALTPKTGKSAGVMRSPLSTYSLYIPADSPLYDLPTLAKIMMCQTWCAHPNNRTNLMVLNPLEWDDMPEPLIETNIFTSRSTNSVPDWSIG